MAATQELHEKQAQVNVQVPTEVSVIDTSDAVAWDDKSTRRLLRKLDWHIIPIMSLIYLLCFLDRTNIGNARLDNLEQDLGLHGLQYNDCLAILFPFYIAAEIPSNLMMKRLRPSLWIAFIMLAWSASMIGQGFVHSYSGLLATRVFLGLSEGGLFPGVNYYLTQFYRRDECGKRMALFFSAATLAGAFGGILARGIAEMRGVGGLAAWSWIFVLEGLASIVVSVAAYFLIPSYPRSNPSFLTHAESTEVQRRLLADDNKDVTTIKTRTYLRQALTDWKIWMHMGMFLAGFCPIYALALFAPTIVKGMGYTANSAQLMSVPPYVCACVVTVGLSFAADRVRQRGVFLLGAQVVAVVGFAMLLVGGGNNNNAKVQYAGLVVAAVGVYPQIPLSMAWNSGNISGSGKRAVGIAMQVMGGNCGGIVASYVYVATDGPRYVKGHSILIGFTCMAFFFTLFMTIWYRRENARRDQVAAEAGRQQELAVEEKLAQQDLADDAQSFRYII